MSEKLKIYACSGVGDTADYNYWSDNTNVLCNTQAVNTLLAYIDANKTTLAETSVTQHQAISLLNEIDLYAVCLYYAQEYSRDTYMLERAGKAIGSLYRSGLFAYNSTNEQERDKHLDNIFKTVADTVNKDVSGDEAFDAWWNKTVIERDKVGMTEEQRELFENILSKSVSGIRGIGDTNWQNDENINKYLDKAGNYFLYTFFTKKQLAKLPKIFTQKAMYQLQVYNYCKSFFVNVYGSEDEMREIIRTQIKKEYHKTPEALCKWIAEKPERAEGIGFAWETFAAVITAIASLVVPIIVAIFQYRQAVDVAAHQSLNERIVKENVPETSDFDGLDMNKNENLPYYLLGGGLLLFALLRQ